MALWVFLDAGPLGIAGGNLHHPEVSACRAWILALQGAGARVVIPEVADYEVRRELIRRGATASLRRLDQLRAIAAFLPISSPAMSRAAELWAAVRRQGLPTADPLALDADAILGGQALTATGAGDATIVATSNPGHLIRFGLDARPWQAIVP